MQCFICVIYLVILCKALPSKDREILALENNANVPFNNSKITSECPKDEDLGLGTEEKVETSALGDFNPNGTETKVSENNLESVDKNKVIDDKATDAQSESNATAPEPISDAVTNEPIYSGINKEYIKFMLTGGTKGNDQLYRPILNEMEDMSQIGDTDRLTIIYPTVIVNFRGTVWNKDSDLKFGQKKKDKRKPESIFS